MEVGKLKAARVSALRCAQVALTCGVPVACCFSNQPCQLGKVALRFGRPPAGTAGSCVLEALVAEMRAVQRLQPGWPPTDSAPTGKRH